MKPSFLGVGAAKCGTATLFDYLTNHPAISMYRGKGFHYFDSWAAHGMSLEDYEKLAFNRRLSRPVFGEITPNYHFYLEDIARAYPGVKVILQVRNPVQRLVSNVQDMTHRAGTRFDRSQPGFTFPRTIRGEQKPLHDLVRSIKRPKGANQQVQRGLYRDMVLQADALGLPLHVIDFADLVSDQDKVWREVCAFLGVPYVAARLGYIKKNSREIRGAEPMALTPHQEKLLQDFYAESNQFMLDRFGIDLTK